MLDKSRLLHYNVYVTKRGFILKIALFTDSFLPGIGGTENVVLKLAKEYSKNHEVVVFAPKYSKPFEEVIELPFKVVRANSIATSKNDFWAHPKHTRAVRQALDEFNPDIIHTHTLGMMADYANKYGKKHNIPVVCTVHTKYAYCYKYAAKFDFIVNILLKRVIKRAQDADRVTSVSYSMIPELKSYGLNKDVTVIKNGLEEEHVSGVDIRKRKFFSIIYVGTIIDYKNIGFSLEAIKELKKIRSDFTFRLIGRGPHERYFKHKAKKMGLRRNVFLTGALTDRHILYETIASADLCLFTSIFDNDSLVLLECASVGVPAMVIKDTGSSERFIDGLNGFIVENDPKAIAERIDKLISDRENTSKVGEEAKKISAPWKDALDAYLKIYQEEIDKKKQSAK